MRRLSGLSLLVIIGLGICGILELRGIGALMHRLSLVHTFQGSPDLSLLGAARAADDRVKSNGVAALVALLFTGVCFLMWFSRTAKTVQQRRPQAMRYSTGWAVGAWFVPFLNLVRPKLIADDIWRGTSESPADQDKPPLWFTMWWITLIMGGMLARIGILIDHSTLDGVANQDRVLIVSSLFSTAAAVLAILVVLGIDDRLQAANRATTIPVVAAAPSAPGGMPAGTFTGYSTPYGAQPFFSAQPVAMAPFPTGPAVPATPAVPADWHPDPTGKHELRYWDGDKWTEHVSTNGVQAVAPV